MKSRWFLGLLFSGSFMASAQVPQAGLLDSAAIKTLFFAGLREKLNENYAKAGENFNKILAIDPKNAAVLYEVAALNFKQNKFPDAEAAIIQATKLDDQNIWYWKLLAELYKRKGDMSALIGVFDHLIQLAPDHDVYYFDRSNAWLLAGKTEEAIKSYEEIERKFGASEALAEARQRIKLEKKGPVSKTEVEKLLAEDGGDIKNLLITGTALMEKKQYDDALTMFKKAKSIDPEDFEIDLTLADVYKVLKNNTEAFNALKSAFNHPDMPTEQKIKIVMVLFTGVKNQQRINDALALAEIAVKIHPDDPKVIGLYGDILYRQGDLQGALAQFKAVLKITDQLYPAWEQTLAIQTGLGLYKEAIKTADEALTIYPNQGILYYYLALALMGDHQNTQALANIKSAMQLDHENAVYMECYGDILFLTGEEQAALVQWKKAKASGMDSEKLNKKINEKKYIK